LTLDRTVHLLRRAMEVPGLLLGMAIKLVKYYAHRNEIATKSHTKTWMEKHEQVEYLVLEE
jgi:hypothetical protein